MLCSKRYVYDLGAYCVAGGRGGVAWVAVLATPLRWLLVPQLDLTRGLAPPPFAVIHRHPKTRRYQAAIHGTHGAALIVWPPFGQGRASIESTRECASRWHLMQAPAPRAPTEGRFRELPSQAPNSWDWRLGEAEATSWRRQPATWKRRTVLVQGLRESGGYWGCWTKMRR